MTEDKPTKPKIESEEKAITKQSVPITDNKVEELEKQVKALSVQLHKAEVEKRITKIQNIWGDFNEVDKADEFYNGIEYALENFKGTEKFSAPKSQEASKIVSTDSIRKGKYVDRDAIKNNIGGQLP